MNDKQPSNQEPSAEHTRPAGKQPGDRPRRTGWLIGGLRYGVPLAIVLGGAIVMALGSEIDLEGGAGIVSAGVATYMMNWLYRASVDGDRVREQEEAARTYFDLHGHWPDEAHAARAAARSSAAPVPGAHPAKPVHAPKSHAGPTRSLHREPGRELHSPQRRRDHR
jgi:hypothetical protein